MSVLHYPQGVKPPAAAGLFRQGGRGEPLEKDINDSNDWYRETDRAVIYKKPTPVQVVKVDYPSRNKARITEAYYRTPSTTDYNGIYKGRYIDFEAKETRQHTSFPIRMIHPHQLRHLQQIIRHGGIGFFIIRFSTFQQTFLVDALELMAEIRQTERSSIRREWFLEHGHPLKEGLSPRLDYLQIVDSLYFEED